MGLLEGLAQMMQRRRGHFFRWVPGCLACGIGAYFALRFEPSLAVLGCVGVDAAVLLVLAPALPEPVAPLVRGDD
jgi:competence protein ComEC